MKIEIHPDGIVIDGTTHIGLGLIVESATTHIIRGIPRTRIILETVGVPVTTSPDFLQEPADFPDNWEQDLRDKRFAGIVKEERARRDR